MNFFIFKKSSLNIEISLNLKKKENLKNFIARNTFKCLINFMFFSVFCLKINTENKFIFNLIHFFYLNNFLDFF